MPKDKTLRILSVARPALTEPRHDLSIGDSMVSAGFPSPADDTHETFDIVSHIVRHPTATFFMRVAGDSMIGAGIFDGDLLVVDRSVEAKSGDIVVAVLDGEFTIKRFRCNGSHIELVPENSKYRKIPVYAGLGGGFVFGTADVATSRFSSQPSA